MPLRVWRTDHVTQLSAHPNDPAEARDCPNTPQADSQENAGEFLTSFTVNIPVGTAGEVIDDLTTREAQSACELARRGKLLRLWLLPAEPSTSRALGLWRARNLSELQAILSSLPLDPWMTTQTTPLTQHPNDPGSAKS